MKPSNILEPKKSPKILKTESSKPTNILEMKANLAKNLEAKLEKAQKKKQARQESYMSGASQISTISKVSNSQPSILRKNSFIGSKT